MLNQKLLSEINKDEEFTLFLLINKYETKTSKTGSSYLSLELRDKSSVISAYYWENYEGLLKDIEQNKIVKVNGVLQDFNGLPQIKIKRIRVATDEDKVSVEDFLPVSQRVLEIMIQEFNDVVNSIHNQYLRKLLEEIFSGKRLNDFFNVPAGSNWHHAYLHGLLEHTLEVVKICELMCEIHPEINRDLLITGALLHDFGKTQELNYDASFNYTDKGKLIGHITICALEVEKAILKVENFPEDLKNQLIHLILSHQGKLEYASPVIPKTLEAIVLYHADELSSKSNAYKYAIKSEMNKNGRWTKFIKLADTSLYIPDVNNEFNNSFEEDSI
ncbi:3'-5' exoribonuclease YhaM family protein [Rosettibacter firmus]|uniref:3'-5' exoribonuclease YhaM family protein n=1 Tax=Rosettibacter firmus TaxID=3111522 RepID=UPI00336C0F5B